MRQEEINILLERYLDGDTTNQEEQQLRDYFTTAADIPSEWRVYKALFGYTAGKARPAASSVPITAVPLTPQPRLRQAACWLAAACVASAVMLVMGQQEEPRSYAVINGRVITSQQLVLQEAEDALSMVSYTDEETFDALNAFNM